MTIRELVRLSAAIISHVFRVYGPFRSEASGLRASNASRTILNVNLKIHGRLSRPAVNRAAYQDGIETELTLRLHVSFSRDHIRKWT